MDYNIALTKDEILYLEVILARPQDEVEDIGDKSESIAAKLEDIDFID